jgi:uncharacterized protein
VRQLRLILAFMLWAALFGAAAGPVFAQSGYSDDRFPHLFAPRDQRPRLFLPSRLSAPPPTTRTVHPPAPEATRPPHESVTPPSEPPGAGTTEVAPTTFVLVLGDNLAEWLAFGLERAFEDVPEIGITDKTRLSSGLVRSEFYDWPKAIPEILAAAAKVDFIVMLVGSNDRQPLRVERDNLEPRSERWREIYVQRVDAIMQALKARGVPVYWVGAPPLRGQRATADMAYLNEIYKERAARNGVTFIDIWNGFTDEQGQYTQFGPDFAGQIRRLRTGDGVHFTAAGARKLALFVEQDLRRDLVGRITPAAPGSLLPDQPRTEPGLLQPEAALPGATVEPPKPRPLMGPVLPLAGNPALPRGGEAPAAGAPRGLAGERPPQAMQGPAASVLIRGEGPAPVQGRADDFRWPRTQAGPSVPENATGNAAAAAGTAPAR